MIHYHFSFQTWLPHIESSWQAWYYSNSSIQSYQLQCGSWLSFMGEVGPWVTSSSSHSLCSFPALGSTGSGSAGFLKYQSLSVLFHSGTTATPRSFWVECIQSSVEVSGQLCISFSSINSSTFVPICSKTCYKSVQASYSSGTNYMETLWLPKVLNM